MLSSGLTVSLDNCCWFCERRTAEKNSTSTVNLHKTREVAVGVRHTVYRYETKSFNVPRCKRCSTLHVVLAWFKFVPLTFIALLVAVFSGGGAGTATLFALIMGVWLGSLPSAFICWLIAALLRVKTEKAVRNREDVRNARQHGWKFYSKPIFPPMLEWIRILGTNYSS
jgi:hypothetical protein